MYRQVNRLTTEYQSIDNDAEVRGALVAPFAEPAMVGGRRNAAGDRYQTRTQQTKELGGMK
jgi:hypothetical protein